MGDRRPGGAALIAVALVVLASAVGSVAGCSTRSDRPVAIATPTAPSTGPSTGPVGGATAGPDRARLQELADLAAMAELAERAADARSSAAAADAADPVAPSRPLLGADIGWPQCPVGLGIPERRTLGLPMPEPAARFVVAGLTNGPGFTVNPCLATQVAWLRAHHVLAAAYAVVSLPSAAQVAEHGADGPFPATGAAGRLGRLANAGYRQALSTVTTMRGAGLRTPVVWLDVEHVPDFEWGSDRRANAAVVEGAARAYADAGYRVGVYSTPSIWADVVGDLALGLAEWRPAGESSRSAALARCGDDWSVQGGRAVLVQWVADQRDHDVTCPGAIGRVDRWFAQH